MLVIALMSLWLKRKHLHTVTFAHDRLVESEEFESELISLLFYLIWAHAVGAHEDEPHADKFE